MTKFPCLQTSCVQSALPSSITFDGMERTASIPPMPLIPISHVTILNPLAIALTLFLSNSVSPPALSLQSFTWFLLRRTYIYRAFPAVSFLQRNLHPSQHLHSWKPSNPLRLPTTKSTWFALLLTAKSSLSPTTRS